MCLSLGDDIKYSYTGIHFQKNPEEDAHCSVYTEGSEKNVFS